MPVRGKNESNMQEAKLSPAVSKLIESWGYAVYSEVPFRGAIDHVGIHNEDQSIVCVEMKVRCDKIAIEQIERSKSITPKTYLATRRKPIAHWQQKLSELGAGVIVNGIVIHEPVDLGVSLARNADMIRKTCAKMKPGGVAGMPTRTGQGHTLEMFVRVLDYRRANKQATWEETYRAIPNLYPNFLAFCSALYAVDRTVSSRPDHAEYVQAIRERLAQQDTPCR